MILPIPIGRDGGTDYRPGCLKDNHLLEAAMVFPRKTLFAAAAAAALLGGCATGPYYGGGYGYDSYGYGYGPAYYDPVYVGPTVGFGYSYYDNGGRRYWREDRDGDGRRDWNRDGRRDWNGDGRRDWNDGRRDGGVAAAPPGGMRDHKGDPIGPGYRP